MKSRDIKYRADVGINPDKLRNFHEDKVQKGLDEVASHEYNDPEFNELLEQIDFDVLRSIFLAYLNRSGIKSEDANILNKKDIMCLSHDTTDKTSKKYNSYAFYSLEANKIFVFFKTLKKKKGAVTLEMLLHVIAHEMTHAASRNEVEYRGFDKEASTGYAKFPAEEFKWADDGPGSIQERVERARKRRFERSIVTNKGENFLNFEESVNEKLSREIIDEYARITGSTVSIKKYKAASKKERITYEYDKFVTYLDRTIDRIAEYVGMPPQTVWEAILRGKFNENDLTDPTVIEELESLFGEGYLKRLSDGNFEDAMTLLEKIPHAVRMKYIKTVVAVMWRITKLAGG